MADKATANPDPVIKVWISPAVRHKASSKQTANNYPVSDFWTLLDNHATLTLNEVTTAKSGSFTMLAHANRLQARAFELLEVRPLDFGLGSV